MTRQTTVQTEQFVEVTGGSLVPLSAETGTPIGSALTIGAEPCVVGRGNHCQLSLDDSRVSTSHCSLVATPRGVRVMDLGSTNGTYVNQVRLDAHSAVYLKSDARMRCGQTWLQFHYAGSEQVPVSMANAFGPLVGGSVAMRRIYAQLAKIAPHDLNVLVTGETGTGKELVAQAIHQASRRHAGPLVVVDCTTIPASLAESQLFGHEKGAFTGAVARHVSPFVEAQGGTLFFDELGELPVEIQPKLLRALESRQIQSVGSTRYQPIDVRVVAATRRNLHTEINAKRFRDDLYFRFAQVVVELPPLRERAEDIPDIAARIFSALGDYGAVQRIDKPTMSRLQRHDWPGNVRELRNVLVTAHMQSGGGPIEVAGLLSSRGDPIDLGDARAAQALYAVRKREVLDALERDYFGRLYREASGNLSEMARRSGLSRPTVREILERHGLRTAD
jgi:DNA-binding NtrC family response regulator